MRLCGFEPPSSRRAARLRAAVFSSLRAAEDPRDRLARVDSGVGALLTGIVSLAGRGDNAAPKDVAFKWCAALAAISLRSRRDLAVISPRSRPELP